MSVDVIENFLARGPVEDMWLIIIFDLNRCKRGFGEPAAAKLSQQDHALLGLKALLLIKHKVAQAIGY